MNPSRKKRVRVRLDDPVSPPASNHPNAEASSIAADRLRGAGAIARFYLGNDTYETRRQIYRMAEAQKLPVGREGGVLVASKARLRRHWDLVSGAVEQGAADD